MQEPLDALMSLLSFVKQREARATGPDNLEPEYQKTVQFIKRHPALRPQVVEEFAKQLQDKTYGRYLLIQYCMHDLRWPEMRERAKEIYAEAQMSLIRQQLYGTASQHLAFLEEVLACFEDAWPSRKLFKPHNA